MSPGRRSRGLVRPPARGPAPRPPPARPGPCPSGVRGLGAVCFRPRFCRCPCPALRAAVRAAGAPLDGRSPLCCAPPLWHVRGLLKERSAPRGAHPSSMRPGRLSCTRRDPAHFHICACRLVPLESPCSSPTLRISLSHTHSQAHGRLTWVLPVTHAFPLSRRLNAQPVSPHADVL